MKPKYDPYPPQREAIDHIVGVLYEKGAALNSSDTGTGKTLMSVEVAREMGLKPLVICPKAVIPSWEQCFIDQGVEYLGIINYEQVRGGNTVVGYWDGEKPLKGEKDRRTFIWHDEVTLIIWDECHKCKEPSTKNSRMMYFAHGEGRYNLPVSATAASNPAEMKTLGFLLGLHSYHNFPRWVKERGCSKNPWKKWVFTQSVKKATEHLERLRGEIYPDCGFKVTRSDLSDFFTHCEIVTDPVDFGCAEEMDRLYMEVEEQMQELADREAKDSVSPEAEALIAMLRARQRVELLKIPLIVEFVKEAVGEGYHVAVFLNFNASIQTLNDKLGGSIPVVWGTDPLTKRGQSGGERDAAIQAFQSNEDNIIILNSAAGGVGINLHDVVGNAPRQALISPDWNEKTFEQVTGRIDRAGALTDTLQRVLFAAGTVEETVRETLEQKLRNLKTLHQKDDMPLAKKTPAKKKAAPAKKVAAKKKAAPTKKVAAKKKAAPREPVAKKTPKKKNGEEVVTIDVEAEIVSEPAHAEYGPSSLRYFEVCPSYLNREQDESEQHEATLSGTRIHNALEIEDPESLDDEDEQHLAWQMLNAVRNSEQEYGVDGGQIFNEIRLKIDLTQHKTFGTLDRLAVEGRVALAQDYKCGWTPVDDAEVNCQAWAYTLGIFQRFPEVEIVYFYFLIPRQNQITMAIFTRDDKVEPEDWWEADEVEPCATMHDIHLRVNLIISRAKELCGKEFSPQPHNCEFCGNKLHCQALADKALLIARARPEDGLDLPDHFSVEDMDDPVALGAARMVAVPLEAWIEEVKKHANKMAAEEDMEIPGFSLRERKTKRTITDAIACYNVAREYGMDLSGFIECAGAMKLTVLEKKIKELAPHGDKKEFLDRFMDELTESEILTGGGFPIRFLQIDRKQNK